MIKVGFIDYYLDEWHANNYPAWIKAAAEKLGAPIVAFLLFFAHRRHRGRYIYFLHLFCSFCS